jgi:phosphoglycerate dehydrogenase-like enzyme
MRLVAYRRPLTPAQARLLSTQFPDQLMLEWAQGLAVSQLEKVEVLCADRLEPSELESLKYLKWLHAPAGWSSICWDELVRREGLLVTVAGCQPTAIGEWFLGAALQKLQPLAGKRLLQVGLGGGLGEICRIARQAGMTAWAVHESATFHPQCDQLYQPSQLHALLPAVDLLVVATPFSQQGYPLLGQRELSLLREGSLLMVPGPTSAIDWSALAGQLEQKRLRVIIDGPCPAALLHYPELTLTSGTAIVAPDDDEQWRFFLRNLRHYAAGDSERMAGLVSS